MPLLDHLIELRKRLIWSLAAFMVAFFISYYFSKQIYSFLAQPLADILQQKAGADRRMIFTALYEAFFTYLKVAFFGAAFISFPVVSIQLWLFVAPGLYRSEKRAMLPFLAATPVLFTLGAALAYYFVFPFAWRFFLSFEVPADGNGLPIQLEAKVGEYLDLVMKLIFAFGITFEMPVLADIARQGRHRLVEKPQEGAPLRLCRHVRGRRHPGAARRNYPDRPGGAADHALYEISIVMARLVEPKPVEDTPDA